MRRWGPRSKPALRARAAALLGVRPALETILLRQGHIDATALARARQRAGETGESIAAVLSAQGRVRPRELIRALCREQALPFADLQARPPPKHLLRAEHIDAYLAHQCLPIGEGPDGLRFASAAPIAPGARAQGSYLRAHPWAARPIALTAPGDIRATVLRRFPRTLGARARYQLAREMPAMSAHRRLSRPQAAVLGAAGLACAGGFAIAAPHTLLVLNVLLTTCFLAVIGLRVLSLLFGLEPARGRGPQLPRAADRELPVYTVMVPLYREAHMVAHLAEALLALDYPRERLDIKLICEADDGATLAAVRALDLPGNFELFAVPPSEPRTKPKALNFALPFARGDFLVIYDAEDRPEPGQLRAAIDAFAAGPAELACVQARLSFYNAQENWLTRQFTIEYAALFDLLLPALHRLGLPIPLGGTSNHFKTDVLRRVGAWDAFNVTEDADLGIRLARLGYQVEMLDSTTREEATPRLRCWLQQRARWLKGWMQTYLTHMRHPLRLFADLGLSRFLAFQVVGAGAVLAALVHPLFFVFVPVALAGGLVAESLATVHGAVLAGLDALVLASGYLVTIAAGWVALRKRGMFALERHALFTPVYWLLISLGAYLALWRLASRPFHWDKTEHGHSRVFARPDNRDLMAARLD